MFETLWEDVEEDEGRLAMREFPAESKDTKKVEEVPRNLESMEQTDIEEGGGNADDMELGELELEGIEKILW